MALSSARTVPCKQPELVFILSVISLLPGAVRKSAGPPAAIRAAFSNWRTTDQDLEVIWEALAKAAEAAHAQVSPDKAR